MTLVIDVIGGDLLDEKKIDWPRIAAEYIAGNISYRQLAEKYGVSPTAIAFAWILRHPAFAQAVTGTTSPERMKEICAAGDITLTHEEWYKLYFATGKVLP